MTTEIFREIYPWAYIMCIVAFGLFAYDKHCALCSKWRVPEFVLFLASLIMGAFGSLCAMVIFNHKIHKKAFTVGVPVILFIQIFLAAFVLTR